MYAMELREFYAVRKRIGELIRATPTALCPHLSDVSEGEVFLKLENQQLTGSFKPRGALNKMLQLSEEQRVRGVVAASTGNHAQGVGYASRMLGVEAAIVVPVNTPKVKIDAIKRYGVDLVVHGDEYMDAERLARRMEKTEEKTFVSGYNDIDIIAGQGTIGLEMVEAHPGLDMVLVPVGGGGLISGVGAALKSVNEDIEVIGVQSVASPVMCESIRRGRIVEMELEESVAEGLHGGIEEGSVTFDMCSEFVDDFILVREETIVRAIGLMLTEERQVVEGAGAVGVAAIMEDPGRFSDRKVGVVISGGNLDKELMEEALRAA